MPKAERREKTLRERRAEDEERRLVNEARDLSLREAGVGSGEARSSHRRRDGERAGSAAPRSRGDTSRRSRSVEEREHRRRPDGGGEGERRRRRDEPTTSRHSLAPAEDQRQRRSQEDTRRRQEPTSRSAAQEEPRRRHDQTSRTSARQIEHQSSLRSLISSSDVDSREMEEEILRQIQEEGLLDGIDLEHIDVNQEDQISERIAEAFRRRQRERSRAQLASSSDASPAARNGQSGSRENSGNEAMQPSPRRQTHSRSTSATSQADEQSRSNPHRSSTHLEIQSGGEGRRRRRTTSGGRSATAPIPPPSSETARPAARSQTDLSDRPRSSHTQSERPLVSSQGRSTIEPAPERHVEAPVELPAAQEPQQSPIPSTSIPAAEQTEGPTIPTELPASTTRSAPPAPIFVPTSTPSAATQSYMDPSLVPAPLSPRHNKSPSASVGATLFQSAARPTSSSSTGSRTHLPRYPEPSLKCARCAKPHIEYELHYNCAQCHNGDWNMCLSCYRSGRGCLHWFGFGYAAWANWEKLKASGEPPLNPERPHLLTANRYLAPKMSPGGADGRRTITSEDPQRRLQSGAFCANCLAWANECWWRCFLCNDDEWGFCNTCVNQGKCCTHPLLPLTYKPEQNNIPPISPTHDQQTPAAATVLTGPGIAEFGPFKPLTFRVSCDICHHVIQPSSNRYHCFSCTSAIPGRQPGDYDVCTKCYNLLESKKRISPENGQNGWRRCLQGHRMIIVGFEDNRGGQRRVIVQDLVGGRVLHEEPSKSLDHSGQDLQQWSWTEGSQVRLVTTDVAATAPTTSIGLSLTTKFPPLGGSGMRALANWSWYPKEGEGDNELLFPRGAEIRECVDINGDWFFGVYMGAKGLFPAPYVRVLDKGPAL
jgi:Zn finger protein HypA/HybF involved in hydrogenase expression